MRSLLFWITCETNCFEFVALPTVSMDACTWKMAARFIWKTQRRKVIRVCMGAVEHCTVTIRVRLKSCTFTSRNVVIFHQQWFIFNHVSLYIYRLMGLYWRVFLCTHSVFLLRSSKKPPTLSCLPFHFTHHFFLSSSSTLPVPFRAPLFSLFHFPFHVPFCPKFIHSQCHSLLSLLSSCMCMTCSRFTKEGILLCAEYTHTRQSI